MLHVKLSSIYLCAAGALYTIISKIIFDKLYSTSTVIVDEEFHLKLGAAYCHYEFEKWHPKVTTFPGLYILSSLILGPFSLCSIYWLRLIPFLFSIVNLFIFHWILKFYNEESTWKNVVSAINMSLLPPLYFFSHVYYTDVPALTMVLLLFIFTKRGNHYLASVFGMFALLLRQTNIIWVGMAFMCYITEEVNVMYHMKSKKILLKVSSKEFLQLTGLVRGKRLWETLRRTSLTFWLNAAAYGCILLSFVVFVHVNGSIVVGDKSAHEATIHLPQIFYFSLFCLFFSWPYFLMELVNFFRFIKVHKFFSTLIVITFLVVVHYNTLVHPYILADNRHYIFYIWNRFYDKYALFKYVMVPVYYFALFVIVTKLWNNKDVTFILFFVPCTAAVLITQKLLELRYFIIPYVLFRARLKTSLNCLLYEFISCVVLNCFVFYTFFTKTIHWDDYSAPQRLIW